MEIKKKKNLNVEQVKLKFVCWTNASLKCIYQINKPNILKGPLKMSHKICIKIN